MCERIRTALEERQVFYAVHPVLIIQKYSSKIRIIITQVSSRFTLKISQN